MEPDSDQGDDQAVAKDDKSSGVTGGPSDFDQDILFKKTRQESKLGMLKVKFLGNALKDFQLIRLADDVPEVRVPGKKGLEISTQAKHINVPSWLMFTRARAALVEPWLY